MTVYAGQDPVTGKRSYLRETVEGTDAQARKKAQRLLTKLHAEVDRQKAPTSSVPFSHVLDEWLATSEIEESTRKGYVGYIQRTIRPALGEVAVDAITSQALERFYVQLRRCRQRCSAVTDGRGESNPETTEHHSTLR